MPYTRLRGCPCENRDCCGRVLLQSIPSTWYFMKGGLWTLPNVKTHREMFPTTKWHNRKAGKMKHNTKYKMRGFVCLQIYVFTLLICTYNTVVLVLHNVTFFVRKALSVFYTRSKHYYFCTNYKAYSARSTRAYVTYRMRRCIFHTPPAPIFMHDTSKVRIVPMTKRSALGTSRREFPEDYRSLLATS